MHKEVREMEGIMNRVVKKGFLVIPLISYLVVDVIHYFSYRLIPEYPIHVEYIL